MTITEDGSMKRTRSSTFGFESINDEPEERHSEEKQPGKLVGLLLRNKYTGIPMYKNFFMQKQDHVIDLLFNETGTIHLNF